MGLQCKLAATSHAAELTSNQTALHLQSLEKASLLVAGHAAQLSHKLAWQYTMQLGMLRLQHSFHTTLHLEYKVQLCMHRL